MWTMMCGRMKSTMWAKVTRKCKMLQWKQPNPKEEWLKIFWKGKGEEKGYQT